MMTEPKPSRPLTPDERAVFLAEQDERETNLLRRLRDEAHRYPELMVTYGFAAAQHPATVGLLAYLHDDVRRESAGRVRDEIAAGKRTGCARDADDNWREG